MILFNTFYSVSDFKTGDRSSQAIITFNAEHAIFAGHFPQVPVVPGVCMMQIVKEITEQLSGHDTEVKQVAQMKFLTLINPREVPSVQIEINYITAESGELQVSATLFNEGVVYFKFKGTLSIAFVKR